jgi:hypothetical protein
MNKRIFKLALKAMDFQGAVDTDTELKLTNSELAKFAELIVRECTDNIAGNIDLINPESSYNYGLRRAMNSVKEHFGVEE